MSPLSFCCATSMFLYVGLLHKVHWRHCFTVPSGVTRGGRRERTALGGSQGAAKMQVIRGTSGISRLLGW